jgi:hypothetical protein
MHCIKASINDCNCCCDKRSASPVSDHFPLTTTQLACIDYLQKAQDPKSLLRRRDMCQPSSNLQLIDEAGGETPNPPAQEGIILVLNRSPNPASKQFGAPSFVRGCSVSSCCKGILGRPHLILGTVL